MPSRPVQDLVWLILLVILGRSVTALLVRHNSSALLNYADILQRVSSAKDLLARESAAATGQRQAQNQTQRQPDA